MGRIIIILLVANFQIATAQDIVQFKLNKPYAVLNFLETMNNSMGTSPTLKRFIETNIPKEDTVFTKLMSAFSRLNYKYNIKRDEIPANRHPYRSTYDLLVVAAVQGETLEDFKKRSIGILPNSNYLELFRILEEAEKYYDKVLGPYTPKMQEQLAALKNYQSKVNDLFVRFKTFYQSSWTTDIPFNVTLFPIPGQRGNSTATPHGNSLCVGVLTGRTDHVISIGIVMHEMCHVLFDEQLSSFQQQLDNVFMQSSSPYAKLAYSFFDEAIATALGNGWAYQDITGKTDTSQWYNNTYINGFAHALYPVVNQYLEAKKPMDNNFVTQAIQIFGGTFPRSTTDFSILLNNMFLYTDANDQKERQDLQVLFRKYFNASRFNFSSPILHEYSVASLKQSKETQLIVVDRNHSEVMKGLKDIFPEIENMLKGKDNKNFVLHFFDKGKRPIIVIYTENAEKIDSALKLLQQEQYLDEKNPYVKIPL